MILVFFYLIVIHNKNMKRSNCIEKLLMSPQIILGACLIMVTFHLITDGTAVKLWKLSQKKANLIDNIEKFKEKGHDISLEIKKHYMPNYLEEIAMERFDMARNEDMVFIFSQNESIKKQDQNGLK